MGFFSKVETAAKEIENEVKTLISSADADVKNLFDRARADALAANAEVNRLKAELQTALAKAASLHQAAVNAAAAAQAAAEADVVKFKAAIAAHTADMNTQASQITPSAAPFTDTTSDTPVAPAQ